MIPHEDDVCEVNRILIEYAFRLVGVDNTTNTAEQDLHLVTEWTLAAYQAKAANEAEPVISDELIAAAQRTTIRTNARGHHFTFAFSLAAAVAAKEEQRAMGYYASDDSEAPGAFLDRLLGEPRR